MSTIPSFRDAWHEALYGERGFYRRNAPADHFRTSVHASPLFAAAIVRLAQEIGVSSITDIGAGRGELGQAIRALAPDLEVYDVELDDELPGVLTGLVIANEWLDNVPCDIVELDEEPRYVLADGSTLGDVAQGNDRDWVDRWWPLAERGDRVEIGRTREAAWASVVRRVADGAAVAIDYGHTRSGRPPYGTLTGYRHGRPCDPVPDGSCDITAHVALDALAAATAPGSIVTTQREALLALGIRAGRPDLALASSDPQRYVAELSAAGEAAELIDPSGLGGFGWVWSFAGTTRPPEWLVSRSGRMR